MNHLFLFLFTLTLFNGVSAEESSIKSALPTTISSPVNGLWIEWDSPDGMQRLQRSEAKENVWKLIRFYEAQILGTYCSVATSVIALNALGIEAPPSKVLGKYRMFTQQEFFTENVCAVIDQKEVAERGLSLPELAQVLQTFPLQISSYEAQSLSQAEIRHLIITALASPNQCVLGLYQRRELQQVGGGHWSPVAAYDAESDSFLILDVARFKYPPVWIDATAFINAMQTANIYGQSRGFIIMQK